MPDEATDCSVNDPNKKLIEQASDEASKERPAIFSRLAYRQMVLILLETQRRLEQRNAVKQSTQTDAP
jgi:hypothetical protein